MYKAILGLRKRPLSAFLQKTCWPKFSKVGSGWWKNHFRRSLIKNWEEMSGLSIKNSITLC